MKIIGVWNGSQNREQTDNAQFTNTAIAANPEKPPQSTEATGGSSSIQRTLSDTATSAISTESSTAQSDARSFCDHIEPAAKESRTAWRNSKISELESQLRDRINELDARIRETREWFARREEAEQKAQAGLVEIYSRMKPESAAQQIGLIDESIAAAILGKLAPRAAGAILAEMPPDQAARLSAAIVRGKTATPEKKDAT